MKTTKKIKTYIYFEIQDGSGTIGKNGNYSFSTQEEANEVATEFKNNPRSHNKSMTDDNVNYWKNKNYTIIKKIIQTEELQLI